MSQKKRIFLGAAVVFSIGLGLVTYDMARQTTFPGSKHQKTSKENTPVSDSTRADSLSEVR